MQYSEHRQDIMQLRRRKLLGHKLEIQIFALEYGRVI